MRGPAGDALVKLPRVGPTRVSRRIMLAGLVAAVAVGSWSYWPMPHSSGEPGVLPAPSPATAPPAVATLDQAAFRVPIWIAPPLPPAPVQAVAPPPLPPLKLQLLAIMHDGRVYRAALYDPDSDRLIVVAAGERVGARTVDLVAPDSVRLRDESGVRTLSLKEGSP